MEWYRAATELYTSSLRALEQRNMAFLFTQSLLVGAFAILLSNFASPKVYDMFIPLLGITIIGLALGIVYFVGHETVSKDTAFWRAYLRWLEDRIKPQNGVTKCCSPWKLCYEYSKAKDSQNCWSRGYAMERLPGPILWLVSPAVFLIVWIFCFWWVIQVYCQSFNVCYFWVVSIVLALIVIVVTARRWRKKEHIHQDLSEIHDRLKCDK